MSEFVNNANIIRNALALAASEALLYNWSKEFCYTNIEDTVVRLKLFVIASKIESPSRKHDIQMMRGLRAESFITSNPSLLLTMPDDLTEQQLINCGFNRWQDPKTGPELWLIPLYLWAFLAPGQALTSISGSSATTGPDHKDLDHRAGMLAYGFMLEAQ